jgi:hypothetical protein
LNPAHGANPHQLQEQVVLLTRKLDDIKEQHR